MSLKFIMTFGNVIPERNVKVKLKICLFSNMVLTYKQAVAALGSGFCVALRDEGGQRTCLEATLIIWSEG